MENIKKKLHPITVWGIYAGYLSNNKRMRRRVEWKSVWRFDPGDILPNNKIVEYAKMASIIWKKLKKNYTQ